MDRAPLKNESTVTVCDARETSKSPKILPFNSKRLTLKSLSGSIEPGPANQLPLFKVHSLKSKQKLASNCVSKISNHNVKTPQKQLDSALLFSEQNKDIEEALELVDTIEGSLQEKNPDSQKVLAELEKLREANYALENEKSELETFLVASDDDRRNLEKRLHELEEATKALRSEKDRLEQQHKDTSDQWKRPIKCDNSHKN